LELKNEEEEDDHREVLKLSDLLKN